MADAKVTPPPEPASNSPPTRNLSSSSLKERFSKMSTLKPMQDAFSSHVPHIAIEFAPAHIPRQRRLQTAAVAIWALMMPITLSLFLFLWYVGPGYYFRLIAISLPAA